MKKLLLSILAVLLCVSLADAQIISIAKKKAAGGNTCTTADDSAMLTIVATSTDATGSRDINNATRWRAQSFHVDCTGTFMLTEYQTRCKRVNNTGNIVLSLYTDSSGAPGSEVAGTSFTAALTTYDSSAGDCTHSLGTPKSGLSCGTTYWFVMRTSDALSEAAMYYDADAGYTDGTEAYDLSYPSSWSTSTGDFRLVIMGCQE